MSRERVGVMSSTQVCAAAGVTYRQLDYWCRAGLVAPSISDAAGQGTRRGWSPADVAAVRRLAVLSRQRRATLAELAG
jgi:DNA-binding transcriptional MerR regulator